MKVNPLSQQRNIHTFDKSKQHSDHRSVTEQVEYYIRQQKKRRAGPTDEHLVLSKKITFLILTNNSNNNRKNNTECFNRFNSKWFYSRQYTDNIIII